MPIFGNGLIGKEFKNQEVNGNTVVIAAGVSNSQETNQSEFKREEEFIKEILLNYKEKKIIYFSSCSILQSINTPYTSHKQKMERLILESHLEANIFRLPQVVGIVNNQTMISYFVKSCNSNKNLTIQQNAYRNLIDVEDVVRVSLLLSRNNIGIGKISNIASSSYIRVLDIANKVKSLLNSDSDIKVVPGGEKYYIDNTFIKHHIGEKDHLFSSKYPMQVIEKYVSQIKESIEMKV